MQHYLGMYDVSCPRLRSAIFKILSAYGIHQQKSVFECQLNPQAKQQLLQQLTLVSSLYQKRIVFLKVFQIMLIVFYSVQPSVGRLLIVYILAKSLNK